MPSKPFPGPPPERFGQYAPAPAHFGRPPDPGQWPPPDTGADPFAAPGPDQDTGDAGPAGPAISPRSLRPETEDWLNAPATGYLDAREAPAPEHLHGPVPPGRRRGYRLPVIAASVAVALAAVVVIVVTHHPAARTGHFPGPLSATNSLGPAPSSYQPTTSPATSTPPDNRKTVTASGIFPKTNVTVGGLTFTRVISALDPDCALAARGAFAAALSSARCQRVARATFVDAAKQYAVTAGVAALPTHAAADKVDGAKRFGPDVWFTGLPGPAHSGANAIGRTVGVGYDLVYGRFIVYALATYASGLNPTGQRVDIQALGALSQSFAMLAQQPLQS